MATLSIFPSFSMPFLLEKQVVGPERLNNMGLELGPGAVLMRVVYLMLCASTYLPPTI